MNKLFICNDQFYSNILIIMIIMTSNNVLYIQSYNNNLNEFKIINRFAYKSVYGLPESLNCSKWIIDQFLKCEILSQNKWHIDLDDYVSFLLKFLLKLLN